jgi:DNA-binding GntR family transcriptional regulator
MASTSKQERVYQVIRKRILSGNLQPGSRIIADAFARELDVSPVPVREAIRRLEAEGFIEYELNVGARVRTLDPTSWSETLEAIAALDGYVTRLALPFITKEDLAEAKSANARMKRVVKESGPEQIRKANQAVHLPLTRRCPNAYLREVLASAWSRLYMNSQGSVFIHHPELADRQVKDHDEIILMIERKKPADQIESRIRKHTLDLIDSMKGK